MEETPGKKTESNDAGLFFSTSAVPTASSSSAISSTGEVARAFPTHNIDIMYDAALFVARSHGVDLFLSEKDFLPKEKSEIESDDSSKQNTDNVSAGKTTGKTVDSELVDSTLNHSKTVADPLTNRSNTFSGTFKVSADLSKPSIPESHSFKVMLVGDGGVGKTAWLKRHATGTFEKNYIPTVGVNVRPLGLLTNKGTMTFHVWDIAGQEKLAGLTEGYYLNADAAIIMFDVTSPMSYRNVANWHKEIYRHSMKSIPTVLVGNKVDEKDRKVKPKSITFHRKKNLQYYDISGKTCYNFCKPFIFLARKLLCEPNLTIVDRLMEEPGSSHGEVSSALFDQYQKELEMAATLPFSIEDEDF